MSLDPLVTYLITGIYDSSDLPDFPTFHTKSQKRQMEIPSHIVMGIQRELLNLGYFEVGFIDGIMGPRTRAALKRYEMDCNREIKQVNKKLTIFKKRE